jgi:monoamine oxidase
MAGKGGGKPGGGGTSVNVAIIGGGMAGLAAALRLRDSGVIATIYESQYRIGGRMLTERANVTASCGLWHDQKRAGSTGWADGQYADVFGELVDTNHAAIGAAGEEMLAAMGINAQNTGRTRSVRTA